jgi:ribosome-binding protein aMBF1 (putative translation factor)
MRRKDDLDEFIAKRTARNPDFPRIMEATAEARRLVRELAAERERQGLSQQMVAEALGTKQPNVARLERGAVDPKHNTLVRYAALLGWQIELRPMARSAANGRKGTERLTSSVPTKRASSSRRAMP